MISHAVPAVKRISIAVTLTAVIGCGGSATQPSSDDQVQVAGSVRDFQTNAAIGGALVTIGNASATTDPNGVYSLTVPAGEHQVSIDGESIGPASMKDRTYRGDFYVHMNGCVARYGTVVDKQTLRPVANASVSVSGSVPATVATDRAGWFRLSLGCPGVTCIGSNTTYVLITHPDYVNRFSGEGRSLCLVKRTDYELEPR